MLPEVRTDGEAPPPGLVAAWLVLGVLPAESVPMWSAYWLAQGYDGKSLAELAGLSGRDADEVRALVPAALEEIGIRPLPSKESALSTFYAQIATMHLDGRLDWASAVNAVANLVITHGHTAELVEPPMGVLWDIAGDTETPHAELAAGVRRACLDQLQDGTPNG
ncbi:hypothetical protein AB0P21_30340 [Kribbella sp. NPDC056861]|uniref:hypothetical protein n=1 Tax=Kribbella sp. NPDC056861 TaxID=3154857 RepID=UPI003429E39E